MSRREISYTWRVREIMARRGVHTASATASTSTASAAR